MKRFQDRVYLRMPEGLFQYDSGWESFRPVRSIVWNPATCRADPEYGIVASDPLGTFYGYGSLETKLFCTELTDRYIDVLDTAEEESSLDSFWKWSKAPVVWTFDRPMLFPSCVDPTWEHWKSFVGRRHRTLRRAPRTFDFRATKRRIK